MSYIIQWFSDVFTFLFGILNRQILGIRLYMIAMGIFTITLVMRFLIVPFFQGAVFLPKSDKVSKGDK